MRKLRLREVKTLVLACTAHDVRKSNCSVNHPKRVMGASIVTDLTLHFFDTSCMLQIDICK